MTTPSAPSKVEVPCESHMSSWQYWEGQFSCNINDWPLEYVYCMFHTHLSKQQVYYIRSCMYTVLVINFCWRYNACSLGCAVIIPLYKNVQEHCHMSVCCKGRQAVCLVAADWRSSRIHLQSLSSIHFCLCNPYLPLEDRELQLASLHVMGPMVWCGRPQTTRHNQHSSVTGTRVGQSD